jgi:hypothetical protein
MEFHLVHGSKIPYCFRSKSRPKLDLSEFEDWGARVEKAVGEKDGDGDLWKVVVDIKGLKDLLRLQKKFGEITLRGERMIEVY